MSAPEQVVRRVQEVLGCERADRPAGAYCNGDHEDYPDWRSRGCDVAVEAADAAFTASLEWAAEQPWPENRKDWLRRLAGTETEATK